MKTLILAFFISLFTPLSEGVLMDSINTSSHSETTHPVKKKGKIQVVLLLDTSNSMDGLIDQAKAQLWKMVNQLASSKKEGEASEIEIALFEYGNDKLAMGEGYVRMVSALTKDVDGISEKLFQLKTNGGSEYCGWVIGDAVKDLTWSTDDNDLKIIVIAGNEPFNQGPKDYKESCKWAKDKDILINTVFCGAWKEGIETFWEDGAKIGKGKYLNIEQDKKVIHIRTPYDDILIQLNIRLNKTYIGYGSKGREMKERQSKQDANAAAYGEANAAQRAAYKAKKQYRNDNWDLLDATEGDDKKVALMKSEDLPEEMQKMNESERKEYIEKLRKERESIQKEIRDLDKKNQEYIAIEEKKNPESNTLDNVMKQTVAEQAKAKGFQF
jgi:von Willebrand factor type A domain